VINQPKCNWTVKMISFQFEKEQHEHDVNIAH
jgi:hypothetical protein